LKTNSDLKSTFEITREMSEKNVIPPHRTRYLSEIAESNRYDETADPRTSSSKIMVFSKQ
jgi:methylmalonyl-CoA mutase